MLWPQFCAGAYKDRSQNMDAEACINLFPGSLDSAANPKKVALYGTPGLIPLVTVSDTICRGKFSHDGRHFAVVGPTLYELTLSGSGPTMTATATSRGTMTSDGTPVYFAINGRGGNQLLISATGLVYVFNLTTNVLGAALTLPLTNLAGQVFFLNSYFLLVERTSLNIWFSKFEDGTTWPGLNFFTRSNASDNIVGAAVIHDQIRVFGTKTSEIFYNVGEANYPFLPYQGTLIQMGAVNRDSIGVVGDAVVFVGKTEWDVCKVMQWGGGAPETISTPAVEFALASYSTVSDGELLAYEQEDHVFANLTWPTADVTWSYDVREQQWHQRARWNPTDNTLHRWRARGTCAPGSQVTLVGDYLTGDLYILSLDRFDDNCARIKRVRRAPYPSAENQYLFVHQIEMGIQSGVGLAAPPATIQDDIDGTIYLRQSRDSGNTFLAPRAAKLGVASAWGQRCVWGPSGRTRGDRLVLEVSTTAAVRQVWGPGLWVRIVNGSGAV